jgi:hypothetical protein
MLCCCPLGTLPSQVEQVGHKLIIHIHLTKDGQHSSQEQFGMAMLCCCSWFGRIAYTQVRRKRIICNVASYAAGRPKRMLWRVVRA